MNTKTQVALGFYSHFLNFNFGLFNHLKKWRTFIVYALSISPLIASNVHYANVFGDEDKPIITINIGACNPAVKNSVDLICYGLLELTAEATDDQTPKDDLLFAYKIDLNNDGIGSHSGYEFSVGPLSRKDFVQGAVPLFHDNPYAVNDNNPFAATGTYPIGIHKICWYVTDSSGNQAALCQLFEIKDCKAPTPYCLTGVIEVPLPSAGLLTIWAKDLDRGSFDNCTKQENLKFYFNGDSSAHSLTITCNDFVAAGANDELFVDVQMWVEDAEGNADYCKTVIIVQDNQEICGDNFPAYVSGKLFSIRDRKDTIQVKNVDFGQIIGNSYFLTLSAGAYKFCPKKHDEHFDSVSTYDMRRIQEHILGTKNFSNIYQQYCADVNQSGSITASDVSEIRKLVLRNIDSFKIPSWLVFPVITPPTNTKNCIDVNLSQGEHRIIDFRGVKIGDVNNLISSENDRILIPNPSDSLEFNIVNRQFKTGDTVYLDFFSKNFNNILGYQYTLKFDTQYLEYEDVIPQNLPVIDKGNFGIRYKDSGYVTTSWIGVNTFQQSIKPDEVLFTLKFLAFKDGTLCDLISITSDLTPAEAYRDSFILHNIVLDVCDVIISSKEATEDLFSVYPNPFQKAINFHFSEAVHFPLLIEIYSLDGKKIAVQQIFNAVEDWTLNANQIKAGIYFIRMEDGENVVYRKIIKE